ncbi:MAG: sugar transferase [Eggerthellaceae bacterium]|nr:sugar transferase [Eggerthellaceae bacterium]
MRRRENIAEVYAQKSRGYKLLKRGFDLVFSAGALVLVTPVMLACAIAIVLEDGRPVIYVAPRKGKDGKPFSMYKFRSMKRGSEELQNILASAVGDGTHPHTQGPAFKAKNDPRMTRVGRFIRKYFIDELPQLVNVIKGDMSLVGPRAIQQTREYTAYEAQRLVVQPGLSCYWQTSGNMRMPWEEWLELDLDYIEGMSIATDLSILAKTLGVVVRGEGAY